MAAGKTKAGVAKRASTRTVVVSKSMRKVDEETRNEVRDRRLQMLEADNYVEAEIASQGDDAYDEDDNTSDFKKKKKARVDGGSKSKSSSISKWAARRNKSLERVVVEQGYDQGKAYDLFASSTDAQIVLCGRYPNYLSVNAAPSSHPARKFCSVCGVSGQYACTRCGMRYCSIKCNNHHKETRCMKFSLF